MRPPPRLAAPAASTPDQAHVGVVDEAREDADRVRAAADARDDDLGQPPLGLEHLRARLAPDHRLQLAHDLGVRRRAHARADQVVGRLDVRDPVADRLARRLLQRARTELDRDHLGAEQPHPLDVGTLAVHVLGAHVDDALEPEPRAHGRGRDAVLAGARLRDDPVLAEPPGEHRLPQRVVELVRAGVEQVLALQVEALPRREALGERERRGPAGERRAQVIELRTDTPDPRARRPSRAPARREPGSGSRGRSAPRTRRRCGSPRRPPRTHAPSRDP